MSIWSIIMVSVVSLYNDKPQFNDFREIVIIPGNQKGLLAKQQLIFEKDSAGCRERDLKITVCSEASCRKKYDSHLKEGDLFNILLIGKDGGVKSVWSRVVETKEIFALVDAMPMRRSEMKRNP